MARSASEASFLGPQVVLLVWFHSWSFLASRWWLLPARSLSPGPAARAPLPYSPLISFYWSRSMCDSMRSWTALDILLFAALCHPVFPGLSLVLSSAMSHNSVVFYSIFPFIWSRTSFLIISVLHTDQNACIFTVSSVAYSFWTQCVVPPPPQFLC